MMRSIALLLIVVPMLLLRDLHSGDVDEVKSCTNDGDFLQVETMYGEKMSFSVEEFECIEVDIKSGV